MATPDTASAPRASDEKFWSTHPVKFASVGLGVKPWSKQREILNALARHNYVAVRSCNGSGKTFTAALATLWWLMTHDEAIVVTTAPTERQVKNLLWREIRQIHRNNRDLIGGSISETKLEMSSKRYAFGFSTNTAERFQGFHHENLLIIVDEAAGVHEFVYDAISGSMTTRNAKMLMIGNPSALAGTFYDAFHKDRDQWHTIHISAFDTPAFTDEVPSDEPLPSGILTPEWATRLERQRGKHAAAYQIRVLGDFPSEADDTLISLKLIEEAIDRRFDEIVDSDAVMGLDIARYGDDQTVAVIRRGQQVVELKAFPKSNLMETTGRALNLARRYGVKKIVVDEVGIGAGVLDRLNEVGKIETIGFNGGKKSEDPGNYRDLRAEAFDKLKDRFAEQSISIPRDAELVSQLASLTYSFNSKGQLVLESKEQIRKTGRQSPDKADALALAFTAPEPKKGSDFHAWVMTDDGVVDIANPTPEQRERMEARRRARLSEIPPLQRRRLRRGIRGPYSWGIY